MGVKALYFADWCQVAEMMKDKKHFTKEGIEKIKKNKSRNESWEKIKYALIEINSLKKK